jgi:hypothetical protein
VALPRGPTRKQVMRCCLAADVVGYPRLMGRDESGILAVMKVRRSSRLLARIQCWVRRQPQLIEDVLGLFAIVRGGSNLARCLAGLGDAGQTLTNQRPTTAALHATGSSRVR